MGICEILTIIFVICKLLGVISWSWWLVLLPEIIAFVIYAVIIVFYVISSVSLNRELKNFKNDFGRDFDVFK